MSSRSKRRGAAWTPAAIALLAFAAVGVAVLDDHGVNVDENKQRRIGEVAVDYLSLIARTAVNSVLPGAAGPPADQVRAGPDYGSLVNPVVDRYYGAAFEGALVLVERLLGLTDSRAIYLMRHLLTHLFFLTGGLFCYLLVYRLFGDRYLALFALLLFLLHPRLYAHSFFNTKDVPFLAMFMIALYLLERAFRRGTTAAFAACGVGVGVLVNLRIMGIMLFAAVAGLRALDLLQADGWTARRRVLATAGAFALAAAGTLYAISPHLWLDPAVIVDVIATLARHPSHVATLFQGELVRWPSIPPHYLPAWMAITTPPATLLLCLTGAGAALRRGAARPRSAAGNTGLRFALLLAACLALPPVAVVAARSNIYHGWRHMYFLYAPLCLLAVYGLRALLPAPGARAARGRRVAVAALAAAALAGMAVDVVRLHPHQDVYFNFLVDRRTPERLRTQYRMRGETADRQALRYLLDRYPEQMLYREGGLGNDRLILPAAARRRIAAASPEHPANFYLRPYLPRRPGPAFGPVLHARRIYGNTVLEVIAVDLALVDQATAGHYRALYRAARAGRPVLRWEWDIYLQGRTLTWIKEPCRAEDTLRRFALQFAPAGADDPHLRRRGHDFRFSAFGVRFDGRCLLRYPLPGYSIRAFEVGRYLPDDGRVIEAAVDLRGATAGVPAGE